MNLANDSTMLVHEYQQVDMLRFAVLQERDTTWNFAHSRNIPGHSLSYFVQSVLGNQG